LNAFDVVFRHSKLSKLIDNTDGSILSNQTTVRMVRSVVPNLNESSKYTVKFNNRLHYPLEAIASYTRPISHPTGVEVFDSTGFTISGNSNTMYLEDTGNGYVRMYYLTGGTTRTYVDTNVGTINYATGEIIIENLNITGTENSDGTIDFITKPDSNDVVAVRDQIVQIDLANTFITGASDTITSGGSSAGTNYTTSSSY